MRIHSPFGSLDPHAVSSLVLTQWVLRISCQQDHKSVQSKQVNGLVILNVGVFWFMHGHQFALSMVRVSVFMPVVAVSTLP